MFWCERHKCKKNATWHRLCQTRSDYRAAWDEGYGPGQIGTARRKPRKLRRKRVRLGDIVSKALALVGVTEERVTEWLGRPCGCAKRRKRLNDLHEWALQALRGKPVNIEKMLDDEEC